MSSRKNTASVRPLVSADLDRIAEIHCRAFPTSVLTLVGRSAVADYYRWVLKRRPDGRGAFAACDGEDAVVGFCIGGPGGAGMRLFLRAHAPGLLLGVARKPWLLAKPVVRHKLTTGLRVVLRRNRSATSSPVPRVASSDPGPATGQSYAILAIASDPEHRAAGVGRGLLHAAECEARELGMTRMHLTVAPENHNAIGFYEHLGWYRVSAPDGRWRGEMHLRLNS